MSLTVMREFRENEPLRRAFDALAQPVLGSSLMEWHRQGYWTDHFRPYLLVRDGLPLACAVAYLQNLCWDGRVHRCVQIGTVLTDPAARGEGFARQLIGEILQDWETAEFIFLLSGSDTAGLFESLGFAQRPEFCWRADTVVPVRSETIPLDLQLPRDRELLWAHTLEGNPFAALTLHRSYELLLLWLMRDPALQPVFLPRSDTVAVLRAQPGGLCCLDLLGGHGTLMQALSQLGQDGAIPLGFAPRETSGCACRPKEDGSRLLVLPGGCEPPFAASRLCLPVLAHS